MISAVFDCVVYVQAVLSSKGPAFACLSMAEEEHVTLYFSPDILDEVKRSLDRPFLRKKYSRLTDETVTKFLERVVNLGTLTRIHRRRFR
jgi:predicted nucleic acid-binding protein